MKKFLLSMAVLALGASTMHAEALNVNDATAIDGTLVEEVNTDKNKAAKHYQPLNSFKLGNYTFTFSAESNTSNKPAYYYNMTGSEDTQNSVRMYKDNSVTITSDKAFGKVIITLKKAGAGINASKSFTATPGGCTVDADKKVITWVNSTAVKSVKLQLPNEKVDNANPNIQIISFEISAETGDVPDVPTPPAGVTYTLQKDIKANGKYNLVANGKANGLFTKNYGYWSTTAVTITDGKYEAVEANAITFEAVEGKANTYYFKDSNGMYFGQDDEHANSFQLSKDLTDTKVHFEWTVAFENDNVKLTNTTTERVVMQDPKYGSFGCYKDAEIQDTFVLPMLYGALSSAVEEIEAVEEGEVAWYTLQGVRVAEPENGLYIRVQGNKATKVLVRK